MTTEEEYIKKLEKNNDKLLKEIEILNRSKRFYKEELDKEEAPYKSFRGYDKYNLIMGQSNEEKILFFLRHKKKCGLIEILRRFPNLSYGYALGYLNSLEKKGFILIFKKNKNYFFIYTEGHFVNQNEILKYLIRKNKPVCLKTICSDLNISLNTSTFKKLEKRGLIKKTPKKRNPHNPQRWGLIK